MLILPAIDLLDGHAVRLVQGDYRRVTSFGADPLAVAHRFVAEGAGWLHLVDLDGARSGRWQHLDLIGRIAAAAGVPVQAGGGARTLDDIRAALGAGVTRVIVGTAAVESVDRLSGWAAELGARLAVGLDGRDGRLVTRGWTVASTQELLPHARKLAEAGVARFVYTDVRRDGTLAGVDLAGLGALRALERPVLVAGGVATYDDLEAVRDAGAEGVIIGRALLEGRLDLRRALEVAARRPEA